MIRKILAPATALALALGAGSTAFAQSTDSKPHASALKGAAVGGVAGHMMGHHAVAGAAVGAAVGHHMRHKEEKRAAGG